MIAAFDVHYPAQGGALTAVVLFSGYGDATAAKEYTYRMPGAADYRPGSFYQRELPCILALMKKINGADDTIDEIIVDGYVDLGNRPGLGRHLYDALNGRIPVIGVAKSRYEGAAGMKIRRGGSIRPLIITSAGTDVRAASEKIRRMHGRHRIPTLLKRVDLLSKEPPAAGPP